MYTNVSETSRKGANNKTGKTGNKNWRNQLELQSMVLPGVIFLFVFSYLPMYGLTMAFREFNIFTGLKGQPWVGFTYFKEFFGDPNFLNVMRNTLGLNLLNLLFGFPAPILLAILITELRSPGFKKVAQTVSYLPHFLSWVIFGGIIIEMLSSNGVISFVGQALGILNEPVNFMAKGEYFYGIYVVVNIIKSVGFSSIIYIAAISGIDQEMFEAARIDGVTRFQKAVYLIIPSILGTMVVLLIFQISSILNTGIEQLLILQNGLNLPWSETIDTYVYKVGLQQSRFSYAAAVGAFKSVVSVLLLVLANFLSKKITDQGLF